jgi:hypothetical protein
MPTIVSAHRTPQHQFLHFLDMLQGEPTHFDSAQLTIGSFAAEGSLQGDGVDGTFLRPLMEPTAATFL